MCLPSITILPLVPFFGQKSAGTFIEPHLRLSERIALRIGYGLSTVVGAAPTVLSLFVFTGITFFTAKIDQKLRFPPAFLDDMPSIVLQVILCQCLLPYD